MVFIYLRNHDNHAQILEYSPADGQFKEMPRSQLQGQPLARGFYINAGDKVIGMYASPDGPICFCNDERFSLTNKACKLELTVGDKENHFVLRWNGQEKISIHYPRVKFTDYDAWSDEETLDFFLWLSRAIDRESFYTYYTVQ